MTTVKCECLNCGWYQWIEELQIEGCRRCGWDINAQEDNLDNEKEINYRRINE